MAFSCQETGLIISAQGFTALAEGLPSARVGELVMMETGEVGIVNALGEESTELLMVERGSAGKGSTVVLVGETLKVPCGKALLGRAINPLGKILDGGADLEGVEMRSIEAEAPPIYKRSRIKDQFVSGVILADLLVPIGQGQREVVMGDAKSGKTTLLLQMMLQAHRANIVGIYVAIGKTRSEIRRINSMFSTGESAGSIAMIASSSSDSTTTQYLAPYAGMAMAEYFRDSGQDVLLVLDDLGNHAKAHREISLLNGRLPGRDSYPGDIFFTHSRLLERAGCVKTEFGPKTITLLPVIETQGGDLTGYVQTNLISMSDGHILFDLETFYRGIRPAINIGLSVSRVGKQTQTKLQKQIATDVRGMIARYGEAKNFVRFGAELTDATKELIQKGTAFEELIKQDVVTLMKIEEQLLVMSALMIGYFDTFAVATILPHRAQMLELFRQPLYDPLRVALGPDGKDDQRHLLLGQFLEASKNVLH